MHAAELQAYVASLEDQIPNPTEEKTAISPTGSSSTGGTATSDTTLQNVSHCGLREQHELPVFPKGLAAQLHVVVTLSGFVYRQCNDRVAFMACLM